MRDAPRRALITLLAILSCLSALLPIPTGRVSADPWIINNPNGTSDAVWNFTNPSDYVFTDTEATVANATLARQPVFWWNSTTAADFAGPDGETNIDRATWPGDVTMASRAGAQTLLTLQPGATGEDTYLDKTLKDTNFGTATTILLDGRNPQFHPLLRFDLSSIPANAVVDGAVLSLYQSAGVGNPVDANLHYVTAQWNELQVTWNDRLTGVGWIAAGGDYDPRNIDTLTIGNVAGWRAWNVTTLVDLWYRGRLTNYGLIIEAPNPGATSVKTFYSSDYNVNPARRPRLDITYRVLGATSEYISKVGGPGTIVAWKTINWNPSVRDFASDEFNGASLDPKWSWTNPPTSYDVGTTTPGSLHVVSSTGTDLMGATFTGNVLSQGIVGDFTATMKYSANPTVAGQRSGLMVLVNDRNWYAVGKANVGGGARNWRVYGTDDGATTVRTDAASTNPVPAWLRIQRAGNTFTALTSNDGITWTLRDTYVPPFEYPLGVRIAFFATDGLSGVAHTADVDYIRLVLGNDATVTMQTRIGDVTPVDGTWTGWTAPYPSSVSSPMLGTSRYIEYRLFFSVWNPAHMAVIGDVNLSWFRYAPAGTIETNDLIPTDLSMWGDLTVAETPNGQTITYEYSLDSGGSWTPIVPPASLQSVSIATGKIRFRVSMSTTNTLITPELHEIRLTYTHRLDHFYVTAPPTAIAGTPFAVTVTAKDALNATITSWTGTVTLAARLADGVTPGGGILGTTTLAIVAGGTATLATETYTKAEVVRILATFGTAAGLSGLIDVGPSPVDHIVVTPGEITILAFDSQVFTAQAYDVFSNPVPGVNFTWAVGGGVGGLNITWGPTVLFTASPPAADGALQASYLTVSGTALIHVTLGPPPWVVISSPAPGAHVTGVVPIAYTNSSDSLSIQFDYDDGTGWTPIGGTVILDGTYDWDTTGLDFVGGSLRATVANNRTATGSTVVSPIEVDNTPPTIAISSVVDDQAVSGTLTILYATDPDVVRVDLTYFDGAWNPIGSDLTIDGSYVWTPGVPINGVTLRAVAIDEVGLTGATERQGVGSYVGPNPPSIAAIPDLHVLVGVTYRLNLTFYLSDPDTPLSALAVSVSDAANVTAVSGAYPYLDVTYAIIGTYDVTLWVSDGTSTAWTIVRVIASANGPPTLVVPLPAPVFDEDTVLWNALGAPTTTYFNDPDSDPLTFAVFDGVSVFARVNANDTIDLWSTANWYGTETLRLRATDIMGGFAEAAFLVTVLPVNDPPVLVTAFAAVAFDEDTTAMDVFGGDAALHFYDVDGDTLTLTVLGGVNVFSRVNPNGTIDLWSTPDWTGSENLRVRATDPSGTFAEGPFLATVRPVNDPPVLVTAFAAVAFDEDTTAMDVFGGDAALHFFDADGDPLTLSVLDGVNVFSRVNANGTIDLWSAANWSGSENLRVRATDPSGTFADGPFAVTVRPVNDPPVLVTMFPGVTFDEDVVAMDVFSGNATLHFFDVDGDPLTLAVLNGVQVSARINPSGTVDLWGAANWSGTENLRVRATDPSGTFADGPFVVTVRPVNDPPIVSSALAAVTFDEDMTALNVFAGPITTHFFDVDGDPLTFTILGASQVQLRMNPDLTIDLWAPANWSGTENLRVHAVDPSGASVDAPFTVIVRPVNDAPVLSPLPNLSVDEGATYTLDLTPFISDIDTPISSITVMTDSQYITVDGRVLTLAYPARWNNATFMVMISDGGATASRIVQVAFIPVWWRSPYMITLPVTGIFVVVSMIAQRARWKPAKAFLVDERQRLLREFSLDPSCDITYDQALQAGALDAVEKPVKVAKYRAQTVRGDALAVVLLAYGPVSMEQVDFARVMLVNIQDKFDDAVKARLEEVRAAEAGMQSRNQELAASLEEKTKALEEREDRLAPLEAEIFDKESQIAEREAAVNELSRGLDAKAREVAETVEGFEAREAAIVREREMLDQAREEFGPKAKAFEARVAKFEEEMKNREAELQQRALADEEERSRLDAETAKFESVQKEKEAWVAGKESDLARREAAIADIETRTQEFAQRIDAEAEGIAVAKSELKEREAALVRERTALNDARTSFAPQQQELQERIAKFEDESKRRKQDLDSQAKSLGEAQLQLSQDRQAFEALRAERSQWIASKEIEIEARSQSLQEKEQAFRAQGEENARRLAELAAREETLEVEGDRLDKAQKELEARRADFDKSAKSVEMKAAQLRDEEGRKAEEYRTWEATLSSQQALLRQQKEAFEKEVTEQKETSAGRQIRLEQMEQDLVAREAKIRTDIEWITRTEDDVKRRETAVEQTVRAAADAETRWKAAEKQFAERSAEVENRERTVREEAAKLTDMLARRDQALKAAEAELAELRTRIEQEATAHARQIQQADTELARKAQALEAKAAEVTQREAKLAAFQQSLQEREEKLYRGGVELATKAKAIEAKELELNQLSIRTVEETGRMRAEAEETRKIIAEKEADNRSERDRLERESNALQEHLGEKALELANRERLIAERESTILQERRAFEAERGTWGEGRAKELQQLEATQHAVMEQTQRSEKLIEEAQRRAYVATEAEKAAKRQAAELTSIQARLEERRKVAEEAERRASAGMAQLNELSKNFAVREAELAAAMKDAKAQEAKAAAAFAEVSRRSDDVANRQADIDRQTALLRRQEVDLQTRKADIDRRLAALDARQADVAQRERVLTTELQRSENLMEDLDRKEKQLRSQEQTAAGAITELSKREAALAKKEAELRGGLESLERIRQELEQRLEETDRDQATATKAREEGLALKAEAEKARAQAEAMHQEVSQNMKFLQKKAVDVLDREESVRRLELSLEEGERSLEARSEALQSKERELENERGEMADKTAHLQAEIDRLQARLEEAEKSSVNAVTMEEWKRDLETRVKILQKKAFELLDREEKLRKKEEELQTLAERLGVQV